jgi:hypothetical protein
LPKCAAAQPDQLSDETVRQTEMKTEDALAGDRRWAYVESDLPLVGNNDGIGLGRGSSQLHDDNDGRGGGNRRQRVHDDAQLTMIGIRLVRVQVRGLSEDKHRQQDQTEHRHRRVKARPGAAFPAEICLMSCQSFLSVQFNKKLTELDS